MTLALKIVEAKGGAKEMQSLVATMITKPMEAVAATAPEKERPLIAKIEARQEAMMIALLPKMIEISEQAYASIFTEQELKDLLAFDESPTGQAMRRKMPELSAFTFRRLTPIIIQQVPQMMDTVLKEVCDEQHCTASDRQTIAALMKSRFPAQAKPAS